ncbi:hypothetical protein [Pseudooceanicola sp.]|uniref:hypothetical protein n=1 Tax=Pseudooceanicola sp. TaxID=1914328 RepID=UPI00405924AB|tara:strand:- start:1510 stop:2976 length:1467 start_codon:yes stop_codon:yes gene_type:complete
MSDSVTNVQIEDVLSSIRKLVSEEVRAQTREPQVRSNSSSAPTEVPASDDRLLLTPSQRVPVNSHAEGKVAPVPQVPERHTADTHDPATREADFIHAEEAEEEADLLVLMERVRAAGVKQAERPRPVGIAAVSVPKPAEPVLDDETISAALVALGIANPNGAAGQGLAGTAETPTDDAMDETSSEELQGDAAFAENARFDGAASDDAGDHADPSINTDNKDATARDRSRLTLTAASRTSEQDHPVASDDAPLDSADQHDADAAATTPRIPTFLRRSGVSSLGQRIADVEKVVTTDGGDWDPEADDDTDLAPEPQGKAVWTTSRIVDERDGLHGNERDDPDTLEVSWAESEIISAAPDGAEESSAALQADDEGYDETYEGTHDDFDRFDTYQTSDMNLESDAQDRSAEWEDDLPGATSTEQDDFVMAEEDRQTLTAEDSTLLDESMLRDLVSEIVRQELQGALGERITRNVRKLVRREIHRALTAQDMR